MLDQLEQRPLRRSAVAYLVAHVVVEVQARRRSSHESIRTALVRVQRPHDDIKGTIDASLDFAAIGTFVFRLVAPRPTFALDMTDEEREIMGRHAAYWQPFVESGQMVVFGPVLDDTGSWGLGVIEADDEDELRAFAASDPVVATGTARIELGRMLAGFVRPR